MMKLATTEIWPGKVILKKDDKLFNQVSTPLSSYPYVVLLLPSPDP